MKDTSEAGPGNGHNSIGVDEGAFLRFVAAFADVDAELEQVRSRRKKLRKQAKAEGIRLGDLDFALKVRNLDDNEAREKLAHTATYLRWLKAPLGMQFELFGESASGSFLDEADSEAEARIMERAEGDGFVAGVQGKPDSDNPHDASGSVGQRWLKGKRDGEESRKGVERLTPDEDEDGEDDEE